MNKNFKSTIVLVLLFAVGIINQGFMPKPSPAPNHTNIVINYVPDHLYAIQIDVSGPAYYDYTQTVYSNDIINYYPDGNETFACDKLFYYSTSSPHTNVYVYVKETSGGPWISCGGKNTDEANVSVTVDANGLTEMEFSYGSLDSPVYE